MKRSQFLLLLFPALLAMLLSVTSFYFSWELHSFYVDEVNLQRAEEKICFMQSMSTIDKRLMRSQIRTDREYAQDESGILSDFGFILIGLSLVIGTFTYRVKKQLECSLSEKPDIQ
ncbi:MAG: hypothetical protein WB444_11150 [Gallionella sp.]